MLSNSPGPQPKSVQETQAQFDHLLSRLNVPFHFSAEQKLKSLRLFTAQELVNVSSDRVAFTLHEFRGCSDGAFIPQEVYQVIDDGRLAAELRKRGIEILLGENSAERHVYSRWRPPLANTLRAVKQRLSSDYSPSLVKALMDNEYAVNDQLPRPGPCRDAACSDWQEAFGMIYGDLQVHALQRGLAHKLACGGAGHLVKRYRIEWRAQCSSHLVPMKWGPTHVADQAIWFYGAALGSGLTADEKLIVSRWLEPVLAWLQGEVHWASSSEDLWSPHDVKLIRRLRSDGEIDVWDDELWESSLRVWNHVKDAARSTAYTSAQSKL